jgi:hypothetical protein
MAGKKVKEIIEAFENLPKEGQDKVFAHLFGVESPIGVKPPSKELAEQFKRIASEVFAENHEQFKKLADKIA